MRKQQYSPIRFSSCLLTINLCEDVGCNVSTGVKFPVTLLEPYCSIAEQLYSCMWYSVVSVYLFLSYNRKKLRLPL